MDARTLADLPRADLVAQCHVPDMTIRQQKEVLRRRIALVRERVEVSNRLTSLLDRYDLVLPAIKLCAKKNLKKLESQTLESDYDQKMMEQSVRHIRYLTDEISDIENTVGDIARHNQYARLIMSLTGFDAFGALLVALEIDDISRFRHPSKIVSWMGLCPTVYQSGNTTRHGKMRRDVNSNVK